MSAAPNAPPITGHPAAPHPSAAAPPAAATHPAGSGPTRGRGTPVDRCPVYMDAATHAAAMVVVRERNINIYESSSAGVKRKLVKTRDTLAALGFNWKTEQLDPRVLLTEDITREINDMTRYKYYLERDRLMIKLQRRALRAVQRREEARLMEEARVLQEARTTQAERLEQERLREEERVREVERMKREALEASAAAGRRRQLRKRAPARS